MLAAAGVQYGWTADDERSARRDSRADEFACNLAIVGPFGFSVDTAESHEFKHVTIGRPLRRNDSHTCVTPVQTSMSPRRTSVMAIQRALFVAPSITMPQSISRQRHFIPVAAAADFGALIGRAVEPFWKCLSISASTNRQSCKSVGTAPWSPMAAKISCSASPYRPQLRSEQTRIDACLADRDLLDAKRAA